MLRFFGANFMSRSIAVEKGQWPEEHQIAYERRYIYVCAAYSQNVMMYVSKQ